MIRMIMLISVLVVITIALCTIGRKAIEIRENINNQIVEMHRQFEELER